MPKVAYRQVCRTSPAGTRRLEIADARCPGLLLIAQTSGHTSFAVRYRHRGRTRKHTIGPYPAINLKAARALASEALRAVAEGQDPAAEKKRRSEQSDLFPKSGRSSSSAT